MKIGILSVQGAFVEHITMLDKLAKAENQNIECVELRKKEDLSGIDGIILPGGESTVQGQLLRKLDMLDTLKSLIEDGLPTLATCAGLILLANKIENDDTNHLATLPVIVRRNAYGRQLGSFETLSNVGALENYPLVFIRAPFIINTSSDVTILASVDNNIVGVEYNNQIGLAFHPELTEDYRIHKMFIDKIRERP